VSSKLTLNQDAMITLKPFNWAHVETHYEWNNDKDLNFYDSDFPHKYESFESFVSRLKEMIHTNDGSSQLFEIICTESGRLIGVVDIIGIDRINNKCVLECTIASREFRNKGYGKNALEEALKYCFIDLGMHKVSTVSFDFNEKWIRILENGGFMQEGCLRKHIIKNGQYCDKLIFSMLNDEYYQVHPEYLQTAEAV